MNTKTCNELLFDNTGVPCAICQEPFGWEHSHSDGVPDSALKLNDIERLWASLHYVSARMGAMMREYDLPEDCCGIVSDSLDLSNTALSGAIHKLTLPVRLTINELPTH